MSFDDTAQSVQWQCYLDLSFHSPFWRDAHWCDVKPQETTFSGCSEGLSRDLAQQSRERNGKEVQDLSESSRQEGEGHMYIFAWRTLFSNSHYCVWLIKWWTKLYISLFRCVLIQPISLQLQSSPMAWCLSSVDSQFLHIVDFCILSWKAPILSWIVFRSI